MGAGQRRSDAQQRRRSRPRVGQSDDDETDANDSDDVRGRGTSHRERGAHVGSRQRHAGARPPRASASGRRSDDDDDSAGGSQLGGAAALRADAGGATGLRGRVGAGGFQEGDTDTDDSDAGASPAANGSGRRSSGDSPRRASVAGGVAVVDTGKFLELDMNPFEAGVGAIDVNDSVRRSVCLPLARAHVCVARARRVA